MMYGKVLSSCVQGIEGQMIEVEVDLCNGLPQVNVVGLPDSAIRESIERVRAAIKNCQFIFPMERITVNLAPADLRKEGSSFDLAIALGILTTSKQVTLEGLEHTLIIGELALDGSLRPVPGVLSMVHAASQRGVKKVVVPRENAKEATLVKGIEVCSITHLREMSNDNRNSFNNINNLDNLISSPFENSIDQLITTPLNEDYADVQGQHQAKRALMITAAGMHNILFIGPPGSGKTMLIRRLIGILPPLSDQEAMEVTKIYSVTGKLADRSQLIRKRPFRSPHHTISQAALIGGGSIPKPGEVSLAHRGILFLDEFPEFTRNALEVLRQPLEDRQVTIGRSRGVHTFPAHFILAASMNPCPCGYLGAETKSNFCICSPIKTEQYRSRVSGPLLDRIDLHVEVPRLDYAAFSANNKNLSSADMQQMISRVQSIQKKRYRSNAIHFNSELSGRLLRKHCELNDEANDLMAQSFDALGLSARAHDRILKIARTIADLEGSDSIETGHLAEAIQYRSLDRKINRSY